MKRILLTLLVALPACLLWAETDVTSQLLTNADFDDASSFCTADIYTYAKDIAGSGVSGMQPVAGWTMGENGDAHAAAAVPYGSSAFVGGSGYGVPAADADGRSNGGMLAVVAVWTATTQYTQAATLPAGKYRLLVRTYNGAGTTAVGKNLMGFIEDDGTEHLLSATTWTVGTWGTQELSFTLLKETAGIFSLGYTAADKGSGAMPHLFVDDLQVLYEPLAADEAVEMTGRIVNAGFESGTTGWTLTKKVSSWEDFKTTSTEPAEGTKLYNLWAANITSLDLSQTVTLPAGQYRLTADFRINTLADVTDQSVYATAHGTTYRSDSTITTVATTWETKAGWNTLGTDFEVLYDDTPVTIGASSTGSGTGTAGWFQLDNFRLFWLGNDIELPDAVLPDGPCNTFWTEADGALQDDYTIDVSLLTAPTAADTLWLLVRNTRMQGAIVPLFAGDADAHSWRLAVQGSAATVWCDSIATATVPMQFLPRLTAGGEQSEVTLVGAPTRYVIEVVSDHEALAPGTYAVNDYGKTVRNVRALRGCTLHVRQAADVWVPSVDSLIVNASINLAHEDAWLITPHWMPSEAIANLLPKVWVDGKRATNGSNVRVAIYLDGAVLVPHTSAYKPFIGYSGTHFEGDATALGLGRNNSLGTAANTFRSFVLKRGYMATLATNSDGSGYSRVYVADHADVVVDVLPDALSGRISSVHVRKWNWVSKKGWGHTGGAGKAGVVRANWFYSWSAGYNTTTDQEYVPEKSHLYWPSWSEINGKENSTCVLGLNEPEHSEQHTSDRCSCGGTISEWNAFNKLHTSFFESGLRIGSPAPTDASYLTNYITYCNNYAYRCDFVVTHAYWKEDIGTWRSRLKAIHDATGRPIWITELEPGASWDTPGYTDVTSAAKRYKQIFDLMEELDYVERFVPYQDDLWYNAMLYADGWPTPAGAMFRDYASSHAYKADQQFVPVWWRPSLKDVTLNVSTMPGRFVAGNPNGDMTAAFVLQYQQADGSWLDVYAEADRSCYDAATHTFQPDLSSLPYGPATFRLAVTVQSGETAYSNEVTCELVDTAIGIVAASPATTVQYLLPDGRPSATQPQGVHLVLTTHADGTVTVQKHLPAAD